MANLTFNLRLSEMEREAKEKVALPFVFSQEKWGDVQYCGACLVLSSKTELLLYHNMCCILYYYAILEMFLIQMFLTNFLFIFLNRKSALLHPGQGAGQIMYEPDANDDFDQEDPDEDLDVWGENHLFLYLIYFYIKLTKKGMYQ